MFFVVVAKLQIHEKNVHYVSEHFVWNINKDGKIRKVEIPDVNASEPDR